MLKVFFSDPIYILDHFKWLYKDKDVDLIKKFWDISWEFLKKEVPKYSEMEYLDKGLQSFITLANKFPSLDPKKNGGAIIVQEGERKYSLF